MLKRKSLLNFGALLVVVLALASFPAISFARDTDTHRDTGNKPDSDNNTLTQQFAIATSSPLALPSAGQGSLVFINYNGGSEELDVTVQNMLYKVPANVNGQHTWFQVFLAPGTYDYTASVPGAQNAQTNSIDVVAGKVTQLGFVVDGTQTLVKVSDNHTSHEDKDRGSRDSDSGPQTVTTIIPGRLLEYTTDITAQVR